SKIIRVLNLWQKNAVFEMDIVQPLLDMATGSLVPDPSPQEDLQAQAQVSSASIAAALPQLPPQLQNPEALAALQKMLQRFQPAQQTPPVVPNAMADQTPPVVPNAMADQTPPVVPNAMADQTPPVVPNAMADQTPPVVPNTMADHPHPQMVQGQHNSHHPLFNTHQTHPTEQKNSLAKKLLDRFDYDDEPEEVKSEEMNPLVPGNRYSGQFPGQMQPNMEQQFQGHMMGQPGRQQTPDGGYHGLNQGYGQSQHTAQQNQDQDQRNSREREDPSGRREGRQRGHGRRSRSRSGSRRKRSRSGSPSRKPRHSSQRSGSRSRENDPSSGLCLHNDGPQAGCLQSSTQTQQRILQGQPEGH
ncbi:unnamed protein product, partial [Coregonus sp. 'balchen']